VIPYGTCVPVAVRLVANCCTPFTLPYLTLSTESIFEVDLKIRTLWGSRHLGFQDGGTEARTFFKVHMNKSSKVTTPFWGSWDSVKSSLTEIMLNLFRDRPKRLFLVTAVTETGAEILLLVSAVTVTKPKLTNDLRP